MFSIFAYYLIRVISDIYNIFFNIVVTFVLFSVYDIILCPYTYTYTVSIVQHITYINFPDLIPKFLKL